jgi:hypothetical protein
MTLQKIPLPLVLVMFTVLCALPAAAAMIPSAAIAQEDDDDYDDSLDDVDDDHQDLASGIVSEVLEEDGGGEAAAYDDDENDQDATSTATINPNQEQDLDQTDFNVFGDETADLIQDQRQANVAIPIGIPVNVEEEEVEEEIPTPPTPPPGGGLPPEFAFFCLQASEESFMHCFHTSEDCEDAEEFFRVVAGQSIISECEGFETLPPNGVDCEPVRDEEGQIIFFICTFPPG